MIWRSVDKIRVWGPAPATGVSAKSIGGNVFVTCHTASLCIQSVLGVANVLKKTCEFWIAITTIHLKVFWIFYIFYKSWNVLLTPNDFCIKFYFTFNITIIAQSFKIRLWILFLASLKINDWLIKKKILLVETIEKMNICLPMHQETGGNVQWILRYSYWFFINIYRYKLQLT